VEGAESDMREAQEASEKELSEGRDQQSWPGEPVLSDSGMPVIVASCTHNVETVHIPCIVL